MRILVSAFLALWLTGCATSTTPVTMVDAQPVATEAVLAPQYLTPDESRTMPVTIVRDQGWMGSLVTMVLKLDGEPIVFLDPEQSVQLYLEPKTYWAAIGQKENYLGEPDGESELTVSKNLPNTFRLRLVYGDGPRIERSTAL